MFELQACTAATLDPITQFEFTARQLLAQAGSYRSTWKSVVVQPAATDMRQKRTAQVKAHIPPDVLEQLELFRAEEGGRVLSMSDYLFTVIEEHIAIRSAMRRPAMRASHQKFIRRVGESTG